VKDVNNKNVVVHGNCSQDDFYQAIFQTYNGTTESADYIVAERASCSETVTFTRDNDLPYNVAVFPESIYSGILSPNSPTTRPTAITTISMPASNNGESYVCKLNFWV